jgi:hypothetical protein
MVMPEDVKRLREWNFGARTLTDRLDVDRLVREIGRYSAPQAAAVSSIIRRDASLDIALDRYQELYREVMQLPVPSDRALRPLLQAMLRRNGRLEQSVRESRADDRMPALDDADIANIRVEIERAPQTMVAAVPTFVQVRVRNQMAAPLGTWQPFPVQVACRWKSADSPRFESDEGAPRTPMHKGVPPGGAESLYVRVVPPSQPGRYVLRVSLVQEYKRWLDQTPTPACADIPVNVTGQTLLTDLRA